MLHHESDDGITPHTLTIHSLTDIDAECSCGRWHMLSAGASDTSREGLREKVLAEHAAHVAHCEEWLAREAGRRHAWLSAHPDAPWIDPK